MILYNVNQLQEQAKQLEEQAKKMEKKTEQLAGEVASLREAFEKWLRSETTCTMIVPYNLAMVFFKLTS